MKILVTGASGLVGSHMLEMASSNLEIVGLARRGSAVRSDTDWVEADLAEPSFPELLPSGLDAIVHLAQPTSKNTTETASDRIDAVDVTLNATVRLLEFARANGVGRFVLASTASVYGASHRSLTETSTIDCTTTNAVTKYAAERLTLLYSGDLDCRILRIFTPYGRGQQGRLIADLISRVKDGREVIVQGQEGLPLSPIHASDVARVALAVAAGDAAAPAGGIYNVAGGERLTIRSMCELISARVGMEPEFRFVAGAEPPGWWTGRREPSQLSDLPPAISFAEGLDATLSSGRENG